jgi:hypothetical protein
MLKLISALTPSSLRVKKRVAPIHCLSVPNGCSTVRLRSHHVRRVVQSFLHSSNMLSCSQRRPRRSVLGVHCGFIAQSLYFELQ